MSDIVKKISLFLNIHKDFILQVLKKIILVELILFLFPIMYFIFILVTGVRHPDLSYMMMITIIIPLILMGPLGLLLVVWKDALGKIYTRAIHFLCFDYNRIDMNKPDKKWPVVYLIFSGMYFFIFSVYFYFAGFKDFGQLIFLSWFGLMFLRLLHFVFLPRTCLKIGKLLFSTFIPFGFFLELGLIVFKHVKISWIEFGVYVFFSISFLISILATEMLFGIFKDVIKKFLKKQKN